ncbi:hypothetical protein [Micromonospora sp. NPDC049301]|uniref:hypothetical protein n=1 Tax=Micromonospora sp. NPDC049301 TaxID=3155723 RepID=UPI0034163364
MIITLQHPFFVILTRRRMRVRTPRVLRMFAAATMVAAAGLAVTPAAAVAEPVSTLAAKCVTGSGSTWYDLGSPYSGTLHGVRVTLQTARVGGAARAIVHPGAGYTYRSGDIISIDRSINSFPQFSPDGNAWTTSEVQARGGWDYCESTLHSVDSIRTGPVEGVNNAVRVCLRRSGALQCTNSWYVDIDG